MQLILEERVSEERVVGNNPRSALAKNPNNECARAFSEEDVPTRRVGSKVRGALLVKEKVL